VASLYCNQDGERITANMAPHEGELTVVTQGPLRRDDCLCDSCNRPLAKAERACLVEFSDRSGLHSQAAEFFDAGKAQVRLIAPAGEEPVVLMLVPPHRWVSHEEWSAPAGQPSFLERLRSGLTQEGMRAPAQDLDREEGHER